MTVSYELRMQAINLVDIALNDPNDPSVSLRRAILIAIEKLASVSIFGISKTRLREWYNLRQITGAYIPLRKRRNFNPLVNEEMSNFIELKLYEDCDLYMDELSLLVWVEFAVLIDEGTILRVVHDLGYTWKVVETVPTGRISQDRLDFRHNFRARAHGGIFSPEQYIFIDETHSTRKDYRRKRGWALEGFPAFQQQPPRPGEAGSVSAIATMSINGTNTVSIIGINDAESFLTILEYDVLPTMNQFPLPKSILIADNAAVHDRVQMYALCARFGVLLMFLPPYSFDFNPIELLFGIAKTKMQVLGGNPDLALPHQLRHFLWNAITPEEACNCFEHCFIHIDRELRIATLRGDFAN